MAETKQLHALSNIYLEAVYGGAKKEAPKDNRLTVTAADKKANTKAYQNYKAGNKAYKAADHLKTEDAKYGYDKKGNSLNPVDIEKKKRKDNDLAGAPDPHRGQGEKIQKRTKKWMDKKGQKGAPGLDAMKARTKEHEDNRGVKKEELEVNEADSLAGQVSRWEAGRRKRMKASGTYERPNWIPKDQDHSDEYGSSKGRKVKKEAFVNWRHDLKEIPDYEQIPVDAKKINAKVEEKNVKNKVKINPEMAEETEVQEGTYEKTKTKEVMGALKKRDLKKDVKKKIAADIVKKKGDTSKSDDRYAYESKLWDEVAANLTELGELNNARFKVEGYQRDPEGGEEKERKAKRERKGGYDEKRARRMNDPKTGINSDAFKEFMRSRGM